MKPAQWIFRLRTRCKDEFHSWLMSEWGYEKYLREKGWNFNPLDLEFHDFQAWSWYCLAVDEINKKYAIL